MRAHAWTPAIREALGGANRALACPCDYGPSIACRTGAHNRCHAGAPQPYPETYITDAAGLVQHLPGGYAHPAPAASGAHHISAAIGISLLTSSPP